MTEKEWVDCARVFNERIHELLPDIKKFWDSVDSMELPPPGVHTFNGLLRFVVKQNTNNEPLKGFQTFPFIFAKDLNIKTHAVKMNAMCNTVVSMIKTVDGMKLYVLKDCKNQKSILIGFLPEKLEGKCWERWTYVNVDEVKELSNGIVPISFMERMQDIYKNIKGAGYVD